MHMQTPLHVFVQTCSVNFQQTDFFFLFCKPLDKRSAPADATLFQCVHYALNWGTTMTENLAPLDICI